MGQAVRYVDPGSEHEVDPWLLTNARPARPETPTRSSREAGGPRWPCSLRRWSSRWRRGFSASAVLPQLRPIWRLSTGTASWLTIAVQLGFVGGAVTSAALNLADVFIARRLILIGAIGAAVANFGLVFASGASVAIPLRFATGFFLAAVYPPALKAMATWFRRGRGTALGIMVGALTLGSALPHLVNGLGGLDWKAVIVATSGLTVAGGLLAELGFRDGPYPFPAANFDPRQAVRVLGNRRSGWPRSGTSGICGSSTRCGPGSERFLPTHSRFTAGMMSAGWPLSPPSQ